MFDEITSSTMDGLPDRLRDDRPPSRIRTLSRPVEPEPFDPGVFSVEGVVGLNRLCLRVATPDPARFRIRREIEALGALRIGTLDLSPMQLLEAYLCASPVVALLRRGTADARIDGRIVTLMPGDGIAFTRIDPRSFISRSASTWYLLSTASPAAWTREVGPVVRIGCLAPALQALTASILGAVRAGTASPAELQHLERAAGHLLNGVLAGDEPDDGGTLDAATLRRRALELIEDRYTDPELRSSGVARSLNVSLRTLQRAYEEAAGDVTVSDDIARFRREHAVRILEDPRLGGLSIAGVAERSGYPRHAGLRRAFTLAFGMSPSEYRAARCGRDRDPRIEPKA
ncbi:helix-turn-helix transcriptional regulator [Microbacteriaceae bacterium VKM Ac-2855]|nr:helix-turn-helix transcriptional regulator [Microbacteriaceae bacterium VKM Ac-2855]